MVCAAVLFPGFWARIAVFLALIFGYLLSWLVDARLRADPLDHRRQRTARRSTTTGSAGPGSRPPTGSASRSGKLPDGVSVVHGPSFSLTFILLVLPGVIALIAENTGHVKAVAEMTETRPRPLHGPGPRRRRLRAPRSPAPFGGSPTTTYAENIGVMGATRVYSTAAYYVAAVVAILLGLCPKFGAIVSATPGGVLGGITVVLYGMIGLVGAKIWVENGVDFGDPVNLVRPRRRPHRRHRRRHADDHRRLRAGRHRARHDPGHRVLPPGQRPCGPNRPHHTTRALSHPEADEPTARAGAPGGPEPGVT